MVLAIAPELHENLDADWKGSKSHLPGLKPAHQNLNMESTFGRMVQDVHISNVAEQVTPCTDSLREKPTGQNISWSKNALPDNCIIQSSPTLEPMTKRSATAQSALVGSMRLLSEIRRLKGPLIVVVIASLIHPSHAFDNEIALNPYPGANVINPDPGPWLHVGFIGTYMLVAAGLMTSTVKNLLAPLMGISSVLWFIMRNDVAIDPSASWSVFGVWSSVTLMYLMYQTRRVMLDKLYVLLALAFSGACLCVVAVVQKSSIQGGLVTAIPPCISFGAYAVAFCFPSRRNIASETPV